VKKQTIIIGPVSKADKKQAVELIKSKATPERNAELKMVIDRMVAQTDKRRISTN